MASYRRRYRRGEPVHKTDAGGVVVGLGDADAVAAAATAMRERIPALAGFLVQRQIARGVEALVGVTSDPSLGPLVLLSSSSI